MPIQLDRRDPIQAMPKGNPGMIRHCATAFAVLTCISAAHAAELRIGLAAPATSMDPHFFNAAPNNTVATHIFDRLTSRDPNTKLLPWLAESWKTVGETTWEFKLRSGVIFHDGSNLTPDDVAFSLARARPNRSAAAPTGSQTATASSLRLTGCRSARTIRGADRSRT